MIDFDKLQFKSRSNCAISCSLDILGDKWTLLIIRDSLFLGSRTFGDFSSSPEKIATNILSDRLAKLVRWGLMKKTRNKKNKLKYDYELTETGLQLESVLMAAGNWAANNIKGLNGFEEQLEKIKLQNKKEIG